MIIRMSDLKESCVRRLLEEAVMKESERSLPIHKRGKERKEKDDATEEMDEENDKLVELDRERGEPSDVEMDDEDMSDEAMEEIKKVSSKSAKPGKKPKAKDA